MPDAKKKAAFICYAREDKEAAKRLSDQLRASGVEVWIDSEDIRPGENWQEAIERGIQSSRYFLALLSRNSVAKQGYVQKELKVGMELLDEFPEGEIFFIPLRLDDCRPTSRKLSYLHWLDLFPSWDEGFQKLRKFITPVAQVGEIFTSFDRKNQGLQQVLEMLYEHQGKMSPHEVERRLGYHSGESSTPANRYLTILRGKKLIKYEENQPTYGFYWLSDEVAAVVGGYLETTNHAAAAGRRPPLRSGRRR